MKSIVFDLDGTLCTKVETGDYKDAQPYKDRIKVVNTLFEEGNTITIHTARGMGRHKNNAIKAIEEFYELTVKQLQDWGVKYNEIYLGKPSGDLYIDDKAMRDDQFFNVSLGDSFE
jgi:capsule biosynthesis phosphatase